METIQIMMPSKVNTTKTKKKSMKERYLEYCDSQTKEGLLWYLIPLMTLSAAVMPPSIFAMSYFTGYIAFIAISILLFYTNIILCIAEQSTRVTITTYFLTLVFHILVPLICFLVSIL